MCAMSANRIAPHCRHRRKRGESQITHPWKGQENSRGHEMEASCPPQSVSSSIKSKSARSIGVEGLPGSVSGGHLQSVGKIVANSGTVRH